MITAFEADRLRRVRATSPTVLSVYLWVPLDLADHRGLSTRARELAKSAPGASRPADSDLDAIAREIALHHQDWLGHTVAIFASREVGLLEAVPLPGQLAEQAVIATRPYTVPLLAAAQRNPAYRVAVIDTRHAWILAVTSSGIDTVAERTGASVPSQGFGGWYGLEAHRIQQRVMRLSRLHFRDTIATLERTADASRWPLVIGGHDSEVGYFLALLPRGLRRTLAGTFSLDLRSVTPARVRELAAPVIGRWRKKAEDELVSAAIAAPPGTTATGLDGCLAAARSHAVAHLVVPDDQMIAGYRCGRCGVLATSPRGCDCAEQDRAFGPVPDLLDELALRVLDDGGQVTAVTKPPFLAAARLRFPVRLPAPARATSA